MEIAGVPCIDMVLIVAFACKGCTELLNYRYFIRRELPNNLNERWMCLSDPLFVHGSGKQFYV